MAVVIDTDKSTFLTGAIPTGVGGLGPAPPWTRPAGGSFPVPSFSVPQAPWHPVRPTLPPYLSGPASRPWTPEASPTRPPPPPPPRPPSPKSMMPPAPNFDADPNVIRAKSLFDAQQAAAKAHLRKMRRQAAIRFGDPSLAQSLGLDASDLAAINANTAAGNSAISRLQHGNDLAKRAIINQLAGRGMLFSGETGYQETEQGRAYGNQVYDARNQVNDYLQGLEQEYLDRQMALQEMLNSAYQQAYYNYVTNPWAYTGTAYPDYGNDGGGQNSYGGPATWDFMGAGTQVYEGPYGVPIPVGESWPF